MINTKRPSTDDYTQVGFVEAKDTQGNYQNIDHIYDTQGNIVFQQGYLNEYQGADNFSIPAIGKPLIDYTIYGNTVQTGTPTPTNPIQPQGTGERTRQIIEYPYSDKSGRINGVLWTVSENGHIKGVGTTTSGTNFFFNRDIFFKAGTYTLKIYGKHTGMIFRIFDSVNSTIILSISSSSSDTYATFTLNADTSNRCRLYFNIGQAGVSVDIDCDIMLNTGSTPLPYEPYGYKIPISSANTTTPVYLGEVETTRRIKKYEFTGQETFDAIGSGYTVNIRDAIGVAQTAVTDAICSHYQARSYSKVYGGIEFGFAQRLGSSEGNRGFSFSKGEIETSQDFQTYLALQYANGTPVTIWYVLAEPTTGIVNEPIRKIGNYADTVSMEQAGVQIPTLNKPNNTVIDVLTEVEPSEVDVIYRGSTKPKYNLFLAQNGDSFKAKDGQSLYIGGDL